MGVKLPGHLISNMMKWLPVTVHFSLFKEALSERGQQRLSPHLNMRFVLQGISRMGRLRSISH